jgi:hypothetical protein
VHRMHGAVLFYGAVSNIEFVPCSDCMSASLEVWGEGQERTCVTPIIIRLSPARLLRLGACLEVDVLERFVSRFIVIH